MDAFRAWAEIDLDALSHNLSVIRRYAGAGKRVMLVVKADAYGHGAIAIAHHAVRCGIGALGVGTSTEALELRHAGIRLPLLVLGTVVDEELSACLRHDVHIGLHSGDRLDSLQDLAKRMGLTARVHLNIDTGMGRLGVLPGRALELLRGVKNASHLYLAGVMTHISSARGTLDESCGQQKLAFDKILQSAREAGLLSGWVHVANSAALFTGLAGPYDTVRPGIGAYGALPADLPGAQELQPVLALRSQVVFLKDVPAGTPVGYGSTWRAAQATRIATLPLGYNDGMPWMAESSGDVLLHGRSAPIVGRVSMDYTTVDVGHIPGVRVGDVATLIGTDGERTISLEEFAARSGTIAYHVSCSVGKRVSRIYRGGEELVVPGQIPRNRPAAREHGVSDSADRHSTDGQTRTKITDGHAEAAPGS